MNAAVFLSGPEALNTSFRDIKKHLVATFSGFQHSWKMAVATFNLCPDLRRPCGTALQMLGCQLLVIEEMSTSAAPDSAAAKADICCWEVKLDSDCRKRVDQNRH